MKPHHTPPQPRHNEGTRVYSHFSVLAPNAIPLMRPNGAAAGTALAAAVHYVLK